MDQQTPRMPEMPKPAPPPVRENDELSGILKYSNKVQGFAYAGAAALVVIIGLRSIYGREIPSYVVISALVLEAILLILIATVYYLTPEEKGGARPSTDSMILSSEKEILGLLKHDVLKGENEIITVLRKDIVGGQKEMHTLIRNDLLGTQREILGIIRNEIIAGQGELLSVLQRIDTQIGKLVENEIDRVVHAKVQDVLAAIVRQEVQKSVEGQKAPQVKN